MTPTDDKLIRTSSGATPTWRGTLEHYLVFPLFLGLWSGFSRLGTREFVVPEGHIYYWVLTAIPSWWTYSLASVLLALALRPWRPPLWAVLCGGYFIGYIFLWTPLMPLRNAIMAPFFAVQPTVPYVETPEWPFFHVVGQIAFGALPWLLINLYHHRVMHVPKFGYAPPIANPAAVGGVGDTQARAPAQTREAEPEAEQMLAGAADPPPTEPLFAAPQAPGAAILSRFHIPPGTRLIALSAQEHYTRVVTTTGARLVLLRFSDALRETAPTAGLQVHRSHWVALDAIAAFTRNGREGEILLSNGETVPVSRSYVRDLQSMTGGAFEAA
jgi:hypothetical protein